MPRERAEPEWGSASLRPDEERFRTILEHAPVMIDSFDEDGTCLIWNRECVRRLGWAQAQLAALDEPLAVFYPDPEMLAAVYEDIARADGLFREYQVLAKDGSVRTQMWANFRVPRTGTIISVGHDVTERRAMEAQLRQAQKMEAVGQLTGGIAHDFNNLLTVILASTDLLLLELEGGSAAEELTRQIRHAAQAGSELVRQLGSFSRQSRLALAPLDLHALLDELAPTLRRLLPESIDVRLEHAAGPLHIFGDRIALDQIVMNLATNARDAIDGRGTIVIATALSCRAPCDEVILSIRDSGHGMTPDVRERAFEPFFTTKEPGKGTGLGLPTVYGLVLQHGGSVELASEAGQGTCVEVKLPVLQHSEGRASSPRAVASEVPRGNVLILVVEDDTGTRATSKAALEHLGYGVVVAEHGAAALALLDDVPGIELVLSDIVMPRMTGPELLTALKTRGGRVPAFAFWTGYTSRDTAATVDPSVPLLSKPWSLEALGVFVRRCLDDREG